MLVRSNKTIFNSPLIAPLLIKENKEIFDNGTQYYPEGGKRRGILGHFFKEDQGVDVAQATYINKLKNMFENKEFNLVIIEMGYSSAALPGNMTNYYKFVGPILLIVPQDRKYFMMTVWRPN